MYRLSSVGRTFTLPKRQYFQVKNNILTLLLCALLLLASGIVHAQSMNRKPARVFITAGQSNTDGRVKNALLPDYIKALTADTTYRTGTYPFCKIVQNDRSGHFVPYWPKGRIADGLWTYDAIVYQQLGNVLQEDFYVVKWAVGGTSIAYQNNNPKGRYWSADPEWLKNTASFERGGNSLLLSFTDAIDAAIEQTLSRLEQGYRVEAFLWHQGESDYKRGAKYYDNLRAVIRHVRQHLTEKTGQDYSRLPFVFGSIPKKNKNFDPLVDAAMQRIAEEDPNAYLVDLSDGDLQGDKLHFTATTAEYFGQQVFKTLDRVLGFSGHGFRVADYRDDKDAAISYTFDDGLKEHYTLVAPWFKKLGFKGTFWINGSKVNADAKHSTDTTRVTWDELRSMAKQGHEISNHGWAHRNFGRHTLEEISEDVFKNDSVLLAEIGLYPRTFCYPNNTKTPEGFALVNENRVGTRLLQRSIGGKSTPQNLEEWVQNLIDSRGWGVGMTHGITYGYDRFAKPEVFWEHLRKVKAQEDKVWVGTFEEVVAYIKERKAITYDIVETKKGLRIRPHLTLDSTLFTIPLTGVIERNHVKGITIRQGKKKLKTRLLPGKVLFDFDPYGGEIEVHIHS